MRIVFLSSLLILLGDCPSPIFGQDAGRRLKSAGDQILPADVYVRVALVRDELELIRYVMGRPKNGQAKIDVTGAAPREVFFQALTLFRKTDRLCFEHTRERASEPKVPESEIRPADVYQVVDAALQRIERVKKKLGIEKKATARERDAGKTPNDVYRAIVQANRQLNLLLEKRFAPSDVFEQVTRAVGYTARLLEHFPKATVIPATPKFEKGKRPADVYRRLIRCFERIRAIAKESGVEMLELRADEAQIEKAEPSDVYDVASLVVSELAYMHAQLPGAKPPRKVYYVGRKFPAHVDQRVGILERQLAELEMWVQKNRSWLGKSAN